MQRFQCVQMLVCMCVTHAYVCVYVGVHVGARHHSVIAAQLLSKTMFCEAETRTGSAMLASLLWQL